jgi:archaeal flagellar protein FlaI
MIQAQVRVKDRFVRRIREVTEIVGFDPETKELLTNTVFEWDQRNDQHRYLGKSYVLDQVMEARGLGEDEVESEWRDRVRVIEWMHERGLRNYREVAQVVSSYYKDREGVLRRIAQDRAASGAAAAGRPAAGAAGSRPGGVAP